MKLVNRELELRNEAHEKKMNKIKKDNFDLKSFVKGQMGAHASRKKQ